MKKILKNITLAAAAILLLGSCAKINERLDNLDKRLSLLGSDGIATISTQIESINSSIADLGTIRTNIQNLTATTAAQAQDIKDLNNEDTEIGKKISDLKKADESINTRIDNLQKYVNDTLKAYATTEWVNATFSTLAQYEATCDTIAKIDARLGSMDTRLSKSIEDCADSLKSWVNVQLDGYYTIAQMDAKVTEMKAQLDTLSGESATAADSLKAEIATAKAEIDTVKANIRTEYKSAIETAITELDGKLNNKLQKQIINVTSQIYSLEPKITELENKFSALKTRIDALESMIQSVTIIPAYNDGSVEGFGSILKIKCVVEPADAVEKISEDDIIVLISEAITKAVKFDTVAVSKLELDKTTGEINIKADISSIPPVPDGKTLRAALEITIGSSNYITGFYPVYSGANVSVTTTEDGSPKIGISSDPDFKNVVSGEIPVEGFYGESKSTTIEVEGFGTITFDEAAAAKIKENASGATNITIKVEDITETFANPVPDADVVLEVTMKAVDEAGTEVFSESNASGKVTIEIPVDPEVVFVKNVTLVDDDGVVIKNGVDPETIKLDLEKHLLSFQVKHFSKYAVGYVKQKDFNSVTGVTLNTNAMTLAVGGTETLTATIAPDNATNKNVTWTSSNTAVATVKDGNVTAVAHGTATITVTTKDGNKTAICAVTVTETKTMAELLSTNPDIPEVNNLTPPSNAWVNSSDAGCRAFVGIDGDGDKIFTAWKCIPGTEEYAIVSFGLIMEDVFVRTDEDTYTHTEDIVTVIAKMTEGKFTSCEFIFDSSAIQQVIEEGGPDDLAEVPILAGTYSAPAKVPNPIDTDKEEDIL